ncbi:hypothetical protein [Listeria marthii]|uniref:hypothetical protein n=1 Tax=Listeria marthii TaxID=529731 RepID=UPI00188700C2|nr:hypothetical protein [Listeria marthii]MBF2536417.1 hypothetical protein [Listeria marthii]
MGIITVVLKLGYARRFEVSDIEKALNIYETGRIEIITDDHFVYTFSNDEIVCVYAEKRWNNPMNELKNSLYNSYLEERRLELEKEQRILRNTRRR